MDQNAGPARYRGQELNMFNGNNSPLHRENQIRKDEFKTVEPAVNFRQITCYNCDHTAIYRFRTIQIRRNLETDAVINDENDLLQWKSIPRFAEIPEVIKCEVCGEILSAYPDIIF